MDTQEALSIATAFVDLARTAGYRIREAYLFGSAVRGTADRDSDIDVALVLENIGNSFDVQVDLMKLRRSIDTRLEPHPFRYEDGQGDSPFLREIMSTGLRVA